MFLLSPAHASYTFIGSSGCLRLPWELPPPGYPNPNGVVEYFWCSCPGVAFTALRHLSSRSLLDRHSFSEGGGEGGTPGLNPYPLWGCRRHRRHPHKTPTPLSFNRSLTELLATREQAKEAFFRTKPFGLGCQGFGRKVNADNRRNSL